MASGIFRKVALLLDKVSAKKFEQDAEEALGKAGDEGGKAMIRALKNSFNVAMAGLREQLAKGLIDDKEFQKRADALADAFNTRVLKSIQKLRDEGKLTDQQFLTLSKSLKKVGEDSVSMASVVTGAMLRLGAAIAAAFAVDRLVAFGRDSVKQAIDAQNAWALLNNQLETLGVNAQRELPRLHAFGEEFQRSTRFDNDEFAKGIRDSLQITGDYERTLRLVSLASDVAVAKQITFSQSMETLSKISNGATRELREFGIKTDDAEAGLERLSRLVRGQTAADLDTVAGKAARIKNQWDDLKKSFGQTLIGGDTPSKIDQTKEAVEQLTPVVEGLGAALNKVGVGTANAVSGLYNFFVRGFAKLGVGGPGAAAADKDAANRLAMLQRAMGIVPEPPAPTPPPVGPLADPNSPEAIAAREAAAHKLQQAEDDQISRLQKAHDLRILNESDVRAILALEQTLTAQVAAGTGSLEERVRTAERLKSISGIFPNISPFLQNTTGGGLRPIGRNATALLRNGPSALQLSAAEALSGGESIKQILGEITDEAHTTARALGDVGLALLNGGSAAIHQLATQKVKENFAWAIEEGALAVGAAFFNPGEEIAHEKAAAGHLAAMAAWGALAGGTSGGSSAVPSSGGDIGASVAAGMPGPGTELHLHIDGIDPQNARHQVLTGKTVQQFMRRGGKIVFHTGNS